MSILCNSTHAVYLIINKIVPLHPRFSALQIKSKHRGLRTDVDDIVQDAHSSDWLAHLDGHQKESDIRGVRSDLLDAQLVRIQDDDLSSMNLDGSLMNRDNIFDAGLD